MGILSHDVEWAMKHEGGRFGVAPGETLRGNVRFIPRATFEARRITASLVGTEEYAYEVTERTAGNDSRVDRRWGSWELWRQDHELQGPTQLTAGEPREMPIHFVLPSDAPPTFESGVLRVSWRAMVSIDVGGGPDPSFDQPIFVPLAPDALEASDPAAMAERFDGSDDGSSYSLSVEPRPLIAGEPFAGSLACGEGLDLDRIRVEVKLRVSTAYRDVLGMGIQGPGGLGLDVEARRAMTETRALWQGTLTEIPIRVGTGSPASCRPSLWPPSLCPTAMPPPSWM